MSAKIEVRMMARAARGFSLIEIMVVVTLMAILVGVGTVFFMGRLEEGKIQTARTQAYEIAKALDLYKLQTGSYPSTSEGLEALTSPPRGGQPVMKEIPVDPWGNPFNYENPGTRNTKGIDVWSNGAGGEEGEEAIGNWRPE